MKDTTYYTHYKGEYIQVLPVEECVKSILSRVESYKNTIERLKEENRKLKDEVWKDEELQDMKEQLDKMKSDYHRGFNITEEEETAQAAIDEFRDELIWYFTEYKDSL